MSGLKISEKSGLDPNATKLEKHADVFFWKIECVSGLKNRLPDKPMAPAHSKLNQSELTGARVKPGQTMTEYLK